MSVGPHTDHFATLELVKHALNQGAQENLAWARDNLRRAMAEAGRDPNQLSVVTGLSVGTIRGFLREKDPTDSSVGNVLLLALGLGIDPSELFRPPAAVGPGHGVAHYEELAAQNPDATISVRDVNGRAIYVSPSSRLTGYEPEELMRLTPDETLELVHPDDRDRMTALLGEVIAEEGRRADVDYRLRAKEGGWLLRSATFWVERGERAEQVLIMIDRPAGDAAAGESAP